MTASRSTNAERSAERPCAACGHRWSAHDDIAARYCAATVVSKASRGCVCVPVGAAGDAEVVD